MKSGKCDGILSPVMRFLEEALFFQDSFSNSKRSKDSSWRKSTVEKTVTEGDDVLQWRAFFWE